MVGFRRIVFRYLKYFIHRFELPTVMIDIRIDLPLDLAAPFIDFIDIHLPAHTRRVISKNSLSLGEIVMPVKLIPSCRFISVLYYTMLQKSSVDALSLCITALPHCRTRSSGRPAYAIFHTAMVRLMK